MFTWKQLADVLGVDEESLLSAILSVAPRDGYSVGFQREIISYPHSTNTYMEHHPTGRIVLIALGSQDKVMGLLRPREEWPT